MTLAETAMHLGVAVASLGGWVLYFRERQRSRDYVTDLLSLVHDHDLGEEDLRRSLEWSEVAEQVERWNE